MADFNQEEAQRFQSEILDRVRVMERTLDAEVMAYYSRDRVDNEEDARENLRDLHRYLKVAYQAIDRMLSDIERRIG